MVVMAPEPRPRRLTEREEEAVEVAAREAAETGRLHLAGVANLTALYTPDVETVSKVFSAQMKVLEVLGHLCPMVTLADEQKVPVDLLASFIPKTPGIEDLTDLPSSRIRSVVNSAPDTLVKIGLAFSHEPIDQAKTSFAEELKRYLKTRIEAARGRFSSGGRNIEAGTRGVPGLNVRVNSNDSNLQILYSPAYFVNIQTVFGNTLSTPVDGFLNPGIYIFGARGRQLPTTFESQKYNIPPSTTVNLISL